MSASPFTRFLAAILPVCFVWAMMACALICIRESSETKSPVAASATELTELKDMSECSGCPFGSFPKASTPERVRFNFNSELHVVAPIVASIVAGTQSFAADYRLSHPVAASPPLEFFSTLRI